MADAGMIWGPVAGEGDVSLDSGETADIIVTDAVTNASSVAQTITHRTTGTAAAGFGTQVNIVGEDAGGSDQVIANIRGVLTTATAGGEVAAYRIGLVSSGSLPAEGSEQVQLGNGQLSLLPSGGGTPQITLGTNNTLINTDGNNMFLQGAGGGGYLQVSNANAILSSIGLAGASSSGGNMTLKSTTHATKGKIYFGAAQTRYYDEAADAWTLGSASLYLTTNAGLTASTTQTQGQGLLTALVNEISTCANANDVVTMPAAAAGLKVTIINNGAQTAQIYPTSGDQFSGLAADASVTLASGANVTYVAVNSTLWEAV